MTFDPPLLSAAIVVWTGWGNAQWPVREEAYLIEEFGSEIAAIILPQIRQLADSFYASGARFTIAGLKEMGDVAAGEFRKAHPEISEDAVRALAWCYTYDYK
ncbi:MAG: hypothetical protein HKL80_06695 [Acidimicrobiales bacterium]|nr:hypothetical protein [Acidimicrobiales bacterium]